MLTFKELSKPGVFSTDITHNTFFNVFIFLLPNLHWNEKRQTYRKVRKKKKINLTQSCTLYGWTDEPAAWTDEEMHTSFKVMGCSGLWVGYCGYTEAEDGAQQVSVCCRLALFFCSLCISYKNKQQHVPLGIICPKRFRRTRLVWYTLWTNWLLKNVPKTSVSIY